MPIIMEGKLRSGFDTLDTGISDIEFVTGVGGPKLITASGPEGGLASYSLRADLMPVFGHNAFYVSNFVTGGGHDIIVSDFGGQTRVHVSGVTADGLTSFRMGEDGNFFNRRVIDDARFGDANSVVCETESGHILLADPEGSGFAIYEIRQDWSLSRDTQVEDNRNTNADGIVDMEAVRIGGNDIVIVASQTEFGISAYRIEDGEAIATGSIGRPEGLGIMVPTDIEIVKVQGVSYVIVASEPSDGNSGALSVMRVRANGSLEPTDHVIDTRDSRFGDVQHISTATVDGHTYVVAGGSDGGLTLFELLPNGQLLHLESIEGTEDMPLGTITALEIAVVGNELQIFVATEEEAGISVLSYDYRGRGDVLIAEDGGSSVTGTARGDVLVDGNGSDQLRGGGGADIFVLIADDETDTIRDFDKRHDKIDLSGWSFLYDVNALEITESSNGAIIRFRGETLRIISSDNRPIDAQDLRDTIELQVNRSFLPPSIREDGTGNDDEMIGSWGMDTLRGLDGDDTISGLDGDDQLFGGSGDDRINGGDGDDKIDGSHGNDILWGEAGNDTLEGGNGNDTLHGQAGEDRLVAGNGDDRIFGGDGNDTLHGDSGNDRLSGGDGNDVLRAGGGNDRINAGSGDDYADGSAGNDTISGLDGDDTLFGGNGDDSITGDNGNDRILGGEGADTLNGGNGSDTLLGGAGNDRLTGGSKADVLRGEDGNDVLSGERGNDLVVGDAGNDELHGNRGNDTLQGGNGDDRIFGGKDNDHIEGGNGDDRLNGDGGRDRILGDNGSDTINGGDGDDSLFGGEGNDKLRGNSGNDFLSGGRNDDYLNGQDGADTLIGGNGSDRLEGEKGRDDLDGGGGNDVLKGGRGNDILQGGRGHDRLEGGFDRDNLNGGRGNDRLDGERGNDTLDGGRGNDRLIGGEGADTFVFRKGNDRDRILDFDARSDRILIDSDLRDGRQSVRSFVEENAVRTSNGIELRFGNGDSLLLVGFNDLSSLDDVISFV